MDGLSGKGDVKVNHSTVSDNATSLIANQITIQTLHTGLTKEDRAERHWRAILQWLSPSEEARKLQEIIHEESRTNHKLESTGLWFIQNDAFQDWLTGGTRRIWVNGPSM
jgi:hypothetical protein